MSLDNVAILIADDNATMADALRLTFEQEGANVVGLATDIEAALQLLEQIKPDCAVLNVGIAYETAMRVTKKLNAIGVPYLILADEADAKAASPHENVRHVARTIDRTQLAEAIKVMIAK